MLSQQPERAASFPLEEHRKNRKYICIPLIFPVFLKQKILQPLPPFNCQQSLKSFTALSFVKAKDHWLTFEKAILFQASLLATHPDKALNRGALKSFTALSFVNVKALWLAVENSVAVLQSSLLATHPYKGLNRDAL